MQNLEDFYSKFLKIEKSLEFGQGQGILEYTNFVCLITLFYIENVWFWNGKIRIDKRA